MTEKTFRFVFTSVIILLVIWLLGWFVTQDVAWVISSTAGRFIALMLTLILLAANISAPFD